ncbi:hypothetical protein [Serratia fonticola]
MNSNVIKDLDQVRYWISVSSPQSEITNNDLISKVNGAIAEIALLSSLKEDNCKLLDAWERMFSVLRNIKSSWLPHDSKNSHEDAAKFVEKLNSYYLSWVSKLESDFEVYKKTINELKKNQEKAEAMVSCCIDVSNDIPPQELELLRAHLGRSYRTNPASLFICPPKASPIEALKTLRKQIIPRSIAEAIEIAVTDMIVEYHSACGKQSDWPTDAVHAAAILGEESGKTIQAALNFHYGNGDVENMVDEATQTGAMAIRFIINASGYRIQSVETNFDGEIPF